jgi:Putative quorum-sensing-regulated virulence factor
VRMPFGKFKGFQVQDLPRDYLEWLMENCDLREPLASAVEGALDDGALSCSSDLPPELRPVVQEIVSVGYRMLALKLHPDQGGDHKQMTRLKQRSG